METYLPVKFSVNLRKLTCLDRIKNVLGSFNIFGKKGMNHKLYDYFDYFHMLRFGTNECTNYRCKKYYEVSQVKINSGWFSSYFQPFVKNYLYYFSLVYRFDLYDNDIMRHMSVIKMITFILVKPTLLT